MSLQVRQLNCPNCGAPLNVQSMGSKQVVCPNCGSQIDLTRPPFSVMGNVGNRPEPIGTPFQLGMQGAVGNDTYSIIGRIRYVDTGETYPSVGGHYDDDDDDDDSSDIWDEWLLLSAQGAYRWFSDSEDVGLVLWYPFTPTVPVDPTTIVRGGTIDLGQGPAKVRSRGSATINYLEGEMTWSARVGDRMNYAEAIAQDNTLLSIEWTENEAEFYAGQRLDRETTEKTFGINRVIPPAGAGGGRGRRAGCSVSMVVLIIIVIVACLVIAALAPATGSGGGIGGVRSGSSGRSTGGGGSSGGGGGGGGK